MAVSATTGPSPACSVCTWVSVTLNGASTLTCGAVVSVDPVTATLPVIPGSDQSGVPVLLMRRVVGARALDERDADHLVELLEAVVGAVVDTRLS